MGVIGLSVRSGNIHKYIVFCDFDGTITVEETFVSMLQQFASTSYDKVENQLIAGDLTLRDAVRRLVESIPANAAYPASIEVPDRSRSRPCYTGTPTRPI